MRWIVGLAVTLATIRASAQPHRMDVAADVSAEKGYSMDVGFLAAFGLAAGLRLDEHTSVGVYGDYGHNELYVASDATHDVAVMRVGLYASHRFDRGVIAWHTGFYALEIDNGGWNGHQWSTSHESWRGVELARPELGLCVYDSPNASAVLYTAYSLSWLSDRSMSTHPSEWVQGVMFGIRVAYAPL